MTAGPEGLRFSQSLGSANAAGEGLGCARCSQGGFEAIWGFRGRRVGFDGGKALLKALLLPGLSEGT